MRLAFLLFSLLLFPLLLPAQSPWPRSKAGLYAQAAWQFIPTYAEIFESKNDPKTPLDREVTEAAFQFYGEYGLDRGTTLTLALPVRFLRSGDFIPSHFQTPETSEGNIVGLGNVSLGIRRAILEGNVRLTGTVRLELPTQRYDDATGLRTGYNTWTVLPMLSTGMGLGKVYWFAYAGCGLRTGGYSYFLQTGAEAGVRVGKIWLIGFSELVYSLENGDVQLPLRNRIKNLYVDKQGYWSFGAKTIFEFNRFFGANFSAAGASWGQFVPKQPAFSLGAYFKWD